MNPASLFKLVGYKNQFQKTHPKFYSFLVCVLSRKPEVGTVIEVTVTHPDGSSLSGNMCVRQSDLELLEEVRNLQKGNG